jgi:hypothetical protein
MKLDFNALAQRLLLGSETLVPSGCLAAAAGATNGSAAISAAARAPRSRSTC